VVVLAFPHHGGLNGVAAPDVNAIATPFGEVAIDAGFGGFPVAPERSVCDHSFEIQVPFLQKCAPAALITPLYVGRMESAERAAAASALAALWKPGTVFVASSDFTHYGKSFGFTPFPPSVAAERLHDLDFDVAEAAGSLDSARFLATLAETGATVCGAGPISLLLDTLRSIDPDLHQITLDYQTSGEITGDYSHSVSYAALGYYPRSAFELAEADQTALLDCAAETIGCLRLTGERKPCPARGESPALDAPRGVFVSLHRGGELLGCIGRCEGRSPLREEVAELALAASLDDPRFHPAASSAGPIDIEISVLTPFRRIWRAEDVQVGKHGLFLRLRGRSGLLLPQVASERGWAAEEFLEAVARKSRLAPRAWRDPEARLYAFEAQVFSRPAAA
jgi:AmmeMemoRadiSam system protein A/AmmeMemoRadiSam system protein B